jgi:hypothetical protein
VGPLDLFEIDKCADEANFVRGIGFPGDIRLAPILKKVVVEIKGTLRVGLRQVAQLIAGINGNGAGGGIEITQFGRAGQVIDLFVLNGQSEGVVEVGVETIPRRGKNLISACPRTRAISTASL